MDRQSLEFISRSAEQTRRIGMRLGALLRPGDLVCLVGDLGAGKTTLVQGIAAGWGSLDAGNSPTFVLVNVYRRVDGGRLYHLDAYRLSGAAEAIDLDLEALLEGGPLVIEWAERIQGALPSERLWVTLRWADENQRDMVFTAAGQRYEALLRQLRRQVFGVI
ncbi:MAG: tRNA (adenosine(37)-N6)-threonylcarbamoyltransferase complex ATPase subunit type 1 TsaE [Anaerolineales bacterium]|nr:tRNA (adenosine(37)-N6)-threonylcarbamoyltransferase complex ATPase subunit type 1 TsaE [Anaerolineales bacterium]